MKKEAYIYIFCLILLSLASSCTEQLDVMTSKRKISIEACMPGSETRGSLEQKSGSLDLIAKWREDDKINIFIYQFGKPHTVPIVSIHDIVNDGKTCSINFELPSDIDPDKPYDIFGLCDIEGEPLDDENTVLAKSQLRRMSWNNINGTIAPVWFHTTGGPMSIIANFKHLGTYEVLHVKNTSKVGVMFSHKGFEVEIPWYKSYENTPLSDSYDPTKYVEEFGDDVSSASAFIGASATGHYLSWYIPSGSTIKNAKLVANIDGKNVVSSNSKSSDVIIQRGHAYHMYATWDGKELKFENVSETEQLQLSTTSLTLTPGSQGTVDVTSGSGSYAAVSNATNVATVTVDGSKIIIKGVSPGTAIITVKDNQTQERAKIEVTVSDTGQIKTETITVNGVSFKMIAVEGGSFMMGSPDDDPDAGGIYSDEKPQHQVILDSYSIGETEVTQALWKAVMGNNPSTYKGNYLPVEELSWDDCQVFISKLNSLTGRNFRLPTEAEWEYAARGGRISKGYKYAGGNNVNVIAWTCENSNGVTHTVATKPANELGLYDMSGNVWEWCYDWYDYSYYNYSPVNNPCNTNTAKYRICRGGSIDYILVDLRIAMRGDYINPPSNRLRGLRLVLGKDIGQQSFLTCPDDHHPHLIDLGLPSGTKWACCNVGADTPEGYGGYYAWGETEEKSYYDWFNYIPGSIVSCPDLGSDISGTEYDVSHVKWGGYWVMPSSDQIIELINNCTHEWTTHNGINCRIFVGPNGGTIFMPAAGYRIYSDRCDVGSMGNYWSSTLNPFYSEEYPLYYSYILLFNSSEGSNGAWIGTSVRRNGRTVRPVVRN